MARFGSLDEWLRWQEGFHPRTIDLGLERVAGVYKALNSTTAKPRTIIVAGTNGKGSCVTFLEAIYKAQGYRVGAYTSPHIVRYNERIKINGQPVSDATICHSFERIDAVRNDVSLSYFEFGTLAALDIFAHAEVDIQLLEVGLGGRLDAVNIVDADVTLISNISIDHTDWLGDTREAIGYEKAGVFRSGVPAVIGDLDPPASLAQVADEKSTPLFCVNKAFSFHLKEQGGWSWHYSDEFNYADLPELGLKGHHQYNNAASVLMSVALMQSILPVKQEVVFRGLQQAHLTGRFQWVDGSPPVLLDVAHNPQAVTTLSDFLLQKHSGKKVFAVFSMMKDKDIVGAIEIMKPIVSEWFVTSLLNNSRVASEAEFRDCFKQCEVSHVHFGFNQTLDAFNAAKSKAGQDGLIVIFGSFFLVSEYLTFIEHNS